MSRLARIAVAVAVVFTALPTIAGEGHDHPHQRTAAPSEIARQDRCDHGVQRSLCTRCNPKLAPVYRAKGDWCREHERPETQCVLCHPELAKRGVK